VRALNYVRNEARAPNLNHMNNNFAFGGINTVAASAP
jgi:3-oxoacyl-(acyl-carrier-protein) synthase